MNNKLRNEYVPDYAVPPGETLKEILDDIPMTQVELARRMGRTPKMVNEIIAGKAPITSDTALLLEQVLEMPARLWNNLELNYREDLARIAERRTLESHLEWLDEVPVREMINLGWISKFDDMVEQLREVLTFFGVATPVQWEEQWLRPQAAFRQSQAFEADQIAVSAWLRKGEVEAQNIECASYEKRRFKEKLSEIRALTVKPPEIFQREMIRLCAESGVALVFVPSLPRTRASGATRWIAPDKAIIQLSLRYKKDDHLWFAFFHETAHIYLHGKRDVFIDSKDGEKNEKERQADRFAADLLIPPARWREFVRHSRKYYSEQEVVDFARAIGIAPGIVAGRLQREDDRVPHSHFNSLKRNLDWVIKDRVARVIEK